MTIISFIILCCLLLYNIQSFHFFQACPNTLVYYLYIYSIFFFFLCYLDIAILRRSLTLSASTLVVYVKHAHPVSERTSLDSWLGYHPS